jgi:CRISPR/Cas system CSM-associated protein Csm3 (group 7 of RAMP superfamily)
MTNQQPFQYNPFEQGVFGVLCADWELETETPLLIRANEEAAFKQDNKGKQKGRGTSVALEWENAKTKLPESGQGESEYSHLTDFNYHFTAANGKAIPAYHIPASSVRGALRNAAIKRLIEMDDRDAFTIPKKEKGMIEKEELEKLVARARKLLEEKRNGWYDVLTLFGSAFDVNPQDDHPLTWASRLRLNVQILSVGGSKSIDGLGQELSVGPGNLLGHVTVRNPIDRVSMSAKEGGLHFALEMSKGEQFKVEMCILNPCGTDARLLSLWRDDIIDGFIRFGGLTSQGRGRVKILKEGYCLFVSRSSALYPEVEAGNKPDLAKNKPLEGIWRGVEFASLAELNKLNLDQLNVIGGE